MADAMISLRSEILEAEKARYDLLKWKLVLVAGLGAAGFGIGGGKSDVIAQLDLDYLICLIPLVCIYVDVLCLHMNLRIMVIARFIRCTDSGGSGLKDYENFARDAHRMTPQSHYANDSSNNTVSAYALENWALQWSTVVVSSLVILYAGIVLLNPRGWALFIVTLISVSLAAFMHFVACYLWGRRFAGSDKLRFLLISLLLAIPYLVTFAAFRQCWVGSDDVVKWTVFLSSGLLGLILTGVMQGVYTQRCAAIDSITLTGRENDAIDPQITSNS